ncbi:MAG: MBL fold metallo-hydrolase [Candidatus Moranbacteria bacterium]|jgi:phosphoribosyl 1,2-cyclic phosphate phosphodiesterase|nr:MBL fold metallo-hydrolase [Candidatus Moranbacteria bacterium]
MMEVTFLGSGCWQGIPAPFGDDEISQSVEWGSKDFRFRTSLHITTDKGKHILVEATPDVRLQSWKFKLGKPDAILISHWHWDHLFGLLDLDYFAYKNRLVVYGNKVTKEWYDDKMSHINVDFRLFKSHDSFLIDNIKITPFAVDHVEGTSGFLFEDMLTGKRLAYLSDLFGLPPATVDLINGIDAIITDATYIESDIDDDSTHLKKDQIIPFLGNLKAEEIILTNIGSYQGLTHSDLEQRFKEYTIAYDGMSRIFL